jgi:hypothetical protein
MYPDVVFGLTFGFHFFDMIGFISKVSKFVIYFCHTCLKLSLSLLYYIKGPVSMVVPRHFLQITSYIYFKLICCTPPLRADNLHVPNHTSIYIWSNRSWAF